MKTKLAFLLLASLALWGCEKTTETPSSSPSPLVGFWKFDDYVGANELRFLAVTSGEGLEFWEKNQMMEFRNDGYFRQFFWNWCGTPPAVPSDWMEGKWEQVSADPILIELQMNDNPGQSRTFELVEIDGTQLVLRWLQ